MDLPLTFRGLPPPFHRPFTALPPPFHRPSTALTWQVDSNVLWSPVLGRRPSTNLTNLVASAQAASATGCSHAANGQTSPQQESLKRERAADAAPSAQAPAAARAALASNATAAGAAEDGGAAEGGGARDGERRAVDDEDDDEALEDDEEDDADAAAALEAALEDSEGEGEGAAMQERRSTPRPRSLAASPAKRKSRPASHAASPAKRPASGLNAASPVPASHAASPAKRPASGLNAASPVPASHAASPAKRPASGLNAASPVPASHAASPAKRQASGSARLELDRAGTRHSPRVARQQGSKEAIAEEAISCDLAEEAISCDLADEVAARARKAPKEEVDGSSTEIDSDRRGHKEPRGDGRQGERRREAQRKEEARDVTEARERRRTSVADSSPAAGSSPSDDEPLSHGFSDGAVLGAMPGRSKRGAPAAALANGKRRRHGDSLKAEAPSSKAARSPAVRSAVASAKSTGSLDPRAPSPILEQLDEDLEQRLQQEGLEAFLHPFRSVKYT